MEIISVKFGMMRSDQKAKVTIFPEKPDLECERKVRGIQPEEMEDGSASDQNGEGGGQERATTPSCY